MSGLIALDLFCGAGGATKGLQRAGFRVVGVDIKPQPRYCGEVFIQANAMEFDVSGFDFVWASPPCQHYCAMKTMLNRREHPDLIAQVRIALESSGIPFVIENVFGAPLNEPVMLCGSFFNLGAGGFQLRRHRYFESNLPLRVTARCRHARRTVGVYGAKARDIAEEKRHYSKPKSDRGVPVGVVLSQSVGFEAMGINWMNIGEAAEAIPPAYSEFIGRQIAEMIS